MSEQERETRQARLAELRDAGVDPFPARVGSRIPVAEVRERFDDASAEELEEAAETVAVCGRV